MRKTMVTTAVAGTLMLGGCASLGGLGGGSGGFGSILGSVLGGGQSGQSNLNEFERAAANACGEEAQRYGRVSLSSAEQVNRDNVQVRGRIVTNNRREQQFVCTFRSDGRIADFLRDR